MQHVPFENPGIILNWAMEHQFPVTATKLYEETSFPNQSQFDWLIVMGGPMNIYEEEEYPWLREEKEFIRRAIDGGKVVLGLCLGAQLIADVIGGRVIKNDYKEIGWFPVTLSRQAMEYPLFSFLPENPVVFEWHGDTFVDLPEEAVLLASNEACKNQAFMYRERVYGFQFHLENTQKIIEDLLYHCAEEIQPAPYIQRKEILSHPEYINQDNQWMFQFLTRLAVMFDKEERCA